MILLDYSQVIFGQVHTDLARNGGTISIDLVRHLVLNQIASFNNRFRLQYGQMVICIDSRRKYWRKKAFEYYKWKRKVDRDDSDIDWGALFEAMNQIRQEVIDNVPLLTFEVDGFEADDLIAALCREFKDEKHIIVSSDKDFMQLQRYPNVSQYSPLVKKFLKADDPDFYRFEHTLRGDKGDGVPNIYSPDNFFPLKEEGKVRRQKSVYATKIQELYRQYRKGKKVSDLLTEEEYKRFEQNKMLVDLVDIESNKWQDHDRIINAFFDTLEEHRNTPYNLYGFMMKNRLRRLMECLDEFQGRGDFPEPKGTKGLEQFTA